MDEESIRKVYQYPHPWPEELERKAERPMDWDREVRGRVTRAVVLGDPGFGKTWLLKHEAWQLAKKALENLEKYPLATDEIKLPIFLPLAQIAEQADAHGRPLSLDKALVPALEQRYTIGKELKEWIKKNLNSERLVLLLDALDEVPHKQKEALCKHLDDFARKYDRTQILLTSRLVGYPGAPFPLPREGEFELLPFDRRQQQEFARAWFSGRPERGDLFLRKLRESPQLHTLARVPLLLALMCQLFNEREELPKSRAELYEACIWCILKRSWKEWKEKKTPQSEDDLHLQAKKRFVEELACKLFMDEKELFYLDELLFNVIPEIFKAQPELKQNLQNKSPAELIGELREDGLLIKAGAGVNPPYLFLHLTFQEYLTACVLARQTSLTRESWFKWWKKIPEWLKIVKPHFFDPRWEEVIRLLAAKLEDATPLIQAIWQEPEDITLGRMLLATKCLIDTRYISAKLTPKIIKEVLILMKNASEGASETLDVRLTPIDLLSVRETRQVFETVVGMLAAVNDEIFEGIVSMLERGSWWRYGDTHTSYLVGFPIEAMLIFALGKTRNERAIPHLLKLLNHPAAWVKEAVLLALGEIGTNEVALHLIRLLRSPNLPVDSWAIARALRKIGNGELVNDLIKLLHNAAGKNQRAAIIEALANPLNQEVEQDLVRLISDSDRDIRHLAVWALGEIGSCEIVPTLLELLNDQDPVMRRQAACALGKIGDERAVPSLVSRYKDPDGDVRGDAVIALGKIGMKAEPYLIKWLDAPDPDLRKRASESLGWIGGERAVSKLIALLEDRDSEVRMRAATSLGRIGDKKAIPGLIKLLEDPDGRVQWEAIKALARLGTEEVISMLTKLLHGPYPGEVRLQAIEALASCETTSESTILSLSKLLKDLKDGKQYAEQLDEQRTKSLSSKFNEFLAELRKKNLDSKLASSYFQLFLLQSFLEYGLQGSSYIILMRKAIARTLGRIGNKLAIQPLYELAQWPNSKLDQDEFGYSSRSIALEALKAISRREGIRILLDGSWVKVR